MSYRRIAVIAVAAASLALGGAITDASSADQPAQPTRHPKAHTPTRAVGLIVQTKTSQSPNTVKRATQAAVGRRADVRSARHITGRVSAVRFDKTLDANDAKVAARAMEERPDVEWAVPDTVHRPTSTKPPVTTNDTYYASLQHLWDRRSPSSTLSTPWPSGGYSTRAPSLWRATTGSPSVIVAVLDSGVTNHKDFNLQRLKGGGYDFVSENPNPESSEDWTRDGDDWDPNPADPGDWETKNDCGYTHPAYLSTWHGTHVAGIVAAGANNKMGVAGVAPGVKFAPVRVLGRCGAFDSDILAAITWSTGGHVDGVPDNPQANWAKVVNLSLGAEYDSSVDAAEQCQAWEPVIAGARERGAVVVVAAGNEARDTKYNVPASCSGAFTVAATNARGFATTYTNYGAAVDVSAPAGDMYFGGYSTGILSTFNRGTTSPGSATYTRMDGTSMAAPMVSAAAALLYSAGMKTPDQVEAGLRAALHPFPNYENDYAWFNCKPADPEFYDCGDGILDLGRVQALLKGKRPAITGTARVGQTLKTKSGYGEWNNSNAGFLYQWYRGSEPIEGATTTSYKLTAADLGQRIKVKLTPKIEAFAPLFHTSVATAEVAKATSTVSASVPAKVSHLSQATVSATVTAAGIPASALVGELQVKDDNTIIATYDLTAGDLGKASITLPPLSKGTHRIRIRFDGTDLVAASISVSRYITVT